MLEKGSHTAWDEFLAEVRQWKTQISLGEIPEQGTCALLLGEARENRKPLRPSVPTESQ